MSDYERFALILDSASEELGSTALRLLELGIDVLYANDLDEAELLARQESERLGAVLIPATFRLNQVEALLSRVQEDTGAVRIAASAVPTGQREPRRIRLTALLLTVLTGATGLVYEVTWQKYLSTLLGSHSEATAAVLGIFLAGLSIGYGLFGRVTRLLVKRAMETGRPPRLLFVYGLIEGGIGVYAILFPVLFALVQQLSLHIPHTTAGVAFAFDVFLVALLLAPPTILMGGTIPLLTQGLSRSVQDATRFHALVYGFNTAGAFFGALAGGFVLVPSLGLATTVMAMGALNLAVGAAFVALQRGETPAARDSKCTLRGAPCGASIPGRECGPYRYHWMIRRH